MRESSIAAIKRHRTARLAKLITRAYYLHRRGREDQLYTMVCNEFMSLGGVYVKFLQGVMLRSEMMKRWHNPKRLQIFEDLDTEPLDIVNILQTELTTEQLAEITLVQPQPFAAGSFGQVYYAQHKNGKPVIIKVLRPMIRELLRWDLRLLAAFSRSYYTRLYKNVDMSVAQAFKDFRDATLRETDYIAEAEFANELFEHYKHHEKYIIPETYMNLCTPHIIVQEYMDGISVAALVKLMQQGVDPKSYVEEQLGSDLDQQLITLGFEELNGIFNLPRVPGDPHPGNIKLLTNNRVGLIDFGIAAHTPPDKAAFYGVIYEWNELFSNNQNIGNLFEQFMRFFVRDLYRALRKLSTLSTTQTTEAEESSKQANFTQEVGKVAQEAFAGAIGTADLKPLLTDGRIVKLVNQMINKNNRFGLIIKLEATEILRAAQTYLTLIETLGRNHVVMPVVFDRVIRQVEHDYPELRHQQDDNVSVADALEIVSNWLERVAERDPALFRQLTERIRMKTQTPAPAAAAPGKEASTDA